MLTLVWEVAGSHCYRGHACASRYIVNWDHWMVFTLLLLLGGRMILTGLSAPEPLGVLFIFDSLGLAYERVAVTRKRSVST